jgi:hypothetical protein
MYTYYPVPSEVDVNKGKGTKENDKLSYLRECSGGLTTGKLMEVLASNQCLG